MREVYRSADSRVRGKGYDGGSKRADSRDESSDGACGALPEMSGEDMNKR